MGLVGCGLFTAAESVTRKSTTPSSSREIPPFGSSVPYRLFKTEESAGTSPGEKMRSNGSLDGIRVYIFGC
jgi:hypothetical protein